MLFLVAQRPPGRPNPFSQVHGCPGVPPVLVVMSGTPLSGKSTLARAIQQAAGVPVALVENDAVRAELFEDPDYGPQENHAVYREATRRVEAALADGFSTIHDATNLKEKWRRGAYDVADELGVPVAVVFVISDPRINEARARTLPATRREAWEKLGGRPPDPSTCRRPHVVLDGAAPVEENLRRLAEWDLLAPLELPRPT